MTEEIKEELTPAEVKPPEVEPPAEDLQSQLQKIQAENLKLQQQLTAQGQRLYEAKQVKSDVETLRQQLDEHGSSIALALDYLEELRGEPVPEVETKPVTHRERLEQRRQEKQAKEPPQVDNDGVKFFSYCLAQDLRVDMQDFSKCDPVVVEAVEKTSGPKEALEYLKNKQRESAKQAGDKEFEARLKQAKEQWAKEFGLTTEASTGPSVPGVRSFTRAEIANMPYEVYEQNKVAIEKAYRAGQIK